MTTTVFTDHVPLHGHAATWTRAVVLPQSIRPLPAALTVGTPLYDAVAAVHGKDPLSGPEVTALRRPGRHLLVEVQPGPVRRPRRSLRTAGGTR